MIKGLYIFIIFAIIKQDSLGVDTLISMAVIAVILERMITAEDYILQMPTHEIQINFTVKQHKRFLDRLL